MLSVNEVLFQQSCLYGEMYICVFQTKTVELWPNGVVCQCGFCGNTELYQAITECTDAFSTWKNNDEQRVLLKIGEVAFETEITNARCSFQSRSSYELW